MYLIYVIGCIFTIINWWYLVDRMSDHAGGVELEGWIRFGLLTPISSFICSPLSLRLFIPLPTITNLSSLPTRFPFAYLHSFIAGLFVGALAPQHQWNTPLNIYRSHEQNFHIRPYPLENSGSRPLSHRQASEGQTSSWVGDHQRIPGVVCSFFLCSFGGSYQEIGGVQVWGLFVCFWLVLVWHSCVTCL